MTNIIEMNDAEIGVVNGASQCTQDAAGAVAAAAGVVGAALAPVSLGTSLVAAALFGLAAGVYAGNAANSCK